MAILTYDTEGDTDLDRRLAHMTRQIVSEAVSASPTIRELCARLGVGYRRTRSLIRALGLRGEYRKWEKAQ